MTFSWVWPGFQSLALCEVLCVETAYWLRVAFTKAGPGASELVSLKDVGGNMSVLVATRDPWLVQFVSPRFKLPER